MKNHPSLKFSSSYCTSIAEYILELWGKSSPTEKHRDKSAELHLLREQHPGLKSGFADQVHGVNSLDLHPDSMFDNLGIGDALLTCHPNIICCVRTADCVPILGFSEEKPLCFAIHAGWRGLHKNIIAITIRHTVEQYGVNPTSLKIMIGPHILRDSYETGREVWSKFDLHYSKINGEKGYLDLTAIAREQLLACGISPANIMTKAYNTLGSDFFFSHRGGDSGRNLNLIYLKA